MRIIWHSNAPFTNSAYGIQTALFVPRIAELGHEIIISSPHSFAGSPLEWKGFRVIPTAGDMIGNDVLTVGPRYYGADLLLTLCDVFKLTPSAKNLAEINVAHWIPIDCQPVGIGDMEVLREGQGTPIAMTHFGERVLMAEGCEPHYVPHGIDPEIYKPGTRQECREAMGFDDDLFVIGICAMNRDPIRKGLSEQIIAFAGFHEKYPHSKLMVHSMPTSNPGMALDRLAASLGLYGGGEDAVMFPDPYGLATGLIGNDAMNAWYNGLDLLSACSYGEGFGMPVLEAQACNVPVVVSDISGTGEMCSAGWRVPTERWWTSGHCAWWGRPDVHDIANAYEAAWKARENGETPTGGREFALQYSADRITEEYWKPVLKQIEADIKELYGWRDA